VVCTLIKGTHGKEITLIVYISPTWGDAPLEPIIAKFGSSLYIPEVINRSKFGVDWFGSFGSGEVQNVHFPIGTPSVDCSTTALARDDRSSICSKCLLFAVYRSYFVNIEENIFQISPTFNQYI